MNVFAHCCASAKLIIKRRKRLRASRGAAPMRPTELRQAEAWSGVVELTIRRRGRAQVVARTHSTVGGLQLQSTQHSPHTNECTTHEIDSLPVLLL